MEEVELKQSRNLFKKLINDPKSVFYSADKINKTPLNKSRKSGFKKDRVFYNVYKALENKNEIWDNEKTRLPFYNQFVEQKKGYRWLIDA